ncbi:MAG: hypothetical protein SP1CHLAM54_04970 [Chlamydiia bacterium]|nr:hypothetical protein [Chlamydiia bacterium]MCH9615409.1 hypothetical protein [Chlamydiia bacterium]MCH9628269.1 hypothetical protein [Chlamydiia bacterium]
MRQFALSLVLFAKLFSANPLIDADNRLSSEIFYLTGQQGYNTLLSPYAIGSNLQLLLMGANGKTANQIRSVLNINAPQGNVPSYFQSLHKRLKSSVHMANGLWVNTQTPLSARLQQKLQKSFGVKAMGAPFKQPTGATAIMNKWVSDQTNKKLKGIVPSLNTLNKKSIILTSALSVKGDWAHPFETKYSKDGMFHQTLSDGKSVKARYMQTEYHFPYYEDDDVQVVALPLDKHFGENHLGFVVFFLKNEASEDPFNFLFDKDPKYYDRIEKMKKTLVRVTLPVFSYHINTDLTSILLAIGMNLPYESTADFSNLSKREKLRLGHVFHGSEMGINENGINAPPPSEETLRPKVFHSNRRAINMKMDRPFFYLLADIDNGLILSMGTYTSPTLEQAPLPKIIPPKPKKHGGSGHSEPRGKIEQPSAPTQPGAPTQPDAADEAYGPPPSTETQQEPSTNN